MATPDAHILEYEINRIPVNGPGIDTGEQAGLLKVVFAGQHEGFEEGSFFVWDFGDPFSKDQINVHEDMIRVTYADEQHAAGRFVLNFSFVKGQMSLYVNGILQSSLWWDQPARNVVQFKDPYIPADGTQLVFRYEVENKNFLVVSNPEELVIHTYTVIGKYVARLLGKLPNGVIVEAAKPVTVGVVTQV
jgi:hypothetical protein